MPIIKSAKKRARTAQKAAVRNRKIKRTVKSSLKSFQSSLTGDKKKAPQTHSKAQSALGKALKKNVIHKNKAARKQRQLAKAAKAANASVAGAKKTVAKKPASKKTTAKKTTTRK